MFSRKQDGLEPPGQEGDTLAELKRDAHAIGDSYYHHIGALIRAGEDLSEESKKLVIAYVSALNEYKEALKSAARSEWVDEQIRATDSYLEFVRKEMRLFSKKRGIRGKETNSNPADGLDSFFEMFE